MATFWFVRHGQSTANAARWLSGHLDVPLTDLGRAQAQALAPLLATVHPERVLASDLRRAWRTAELAWGERQPAIERTEGLRERHLGALEGEPIDALRASGAMTRLLTWDGAPPGGESQAMLAVRAVACLSTYEEGLDTLIFAHGGLIRTVLGLLDGTPRHEVGRRPVGNTEIVERMVPDGTWLRLAASLRA